MTTLTRSKPAVADAQQEIFITDSIVPSPFPTDAYQREREQEDLLIKLACEELDINPFLDQPPKDLDSLMEDSPKGDLHHMQPAELQKNQQDLENTETVRGPHATFY